MSESQIYLGSNVRSLRERNGYDQAQLAEMLGVSQVQVHYVEVGNRSFSVKRLAQVATLFGVTIDDLLFSDMTNGDQVAA